MLFTTGMDVKYSVHCKVAGQVREVSQEMYVVHTVYDKL